ncbi:MAG: DUF2088 domain-containing protein, partial [Candidatus Dormibacteraeota bacterium]|nr:DUF2088 domain-containing protein [Candidatus Dormibacteraeota bacterium]
MAWEVRTQAVLEEERSHPALPLWRRIRQTPTHHGVPSVAGAVQEQLARPEIRASIRPGMRVAVGVGSRGIGCLQEAVRATVAGLRSLGAEPFIVPAMGSHGGATPEGQEALLAGYGVTEAEVGAPIRSGMETVSIGSVLDGVPLHLSKVVLDEADAVVPVCRVKPHTDFRYEVESGLHKMLAIGFGKHRGASTIHTYPLDRFGEIIEAAGRHVMTRVEVPFGIAIVEDAYEDPGIVEAVPGAAIGTRERELLEIAKSWLLRLPFESADVLVVQELGKNISGAGMDPNITGRFAEPSIPRPLIVQLLAFLDLTDATHGNATGMGFAELTTRRVMEKVDVAATYTNAVTSQILSAARVPIVAETDQELFAIACSTLRRTPAERARIAWIRNTLELLELRVSEPLWAEMRTHEDVVA